MKGLSWRFWNFAYSHFWNLDSKSGSLSKKNVRLKAGTPRECNNADCLLIFAPKPISVVYDVILGEKVYHGHFTSMCI